MNNLKATRRLVLWAIELDEFDILYRPKIAIKAQALADFVAEFTAKEDKDEGPKTWMIWTDDSFNQCTGGVKVVLQSLEGDLVECTIHLQFPTTNNEAEYEAVLLGLDITKAVEASSVVIHSDSQVIVEHINRDYEAKGEWMKEYLNMVKGRVSQKLLVKFMQISRKRISKLIV